MGKKRGKPWRYQKDRVFIFLFREVSHFETGQSILKWNNHFTRYTCSFWNVKITSWFSQCSLQKVLLWVWSFPAPAFLPTTTPCQVRSSIKVWIVRRKKRMKHKLATVVTIPLYRRAPASYFHTCLICGYRHPHLDHTFDSPICSWKDYYVYPLVWWTLERL